MGKRRERPEIKIVAHYRVIEGVKTEIDPYKTDLPLRCRLAVAEMVTGKKYKVAGS